MTEKQLSKRVRKGVKRLEQEHNLRNGLPLKHKNKKLRKGLREALICFYVDAYELVREPTLKLLPTKQK